MSSSWQSYSPSHTRPSTDISFAFIFPSILSHGVNDNQIKILGSKDYFDNRNLNSNDPFNRATLDDPIGYVLQDQFFYDPNSGALGASDTVDTIELIFRNRDEVFDQEEADADGVIATGVKELYQREIIDIAVRKMTGNIESANIQYQQIEAEQSKSI